jgi:serine protease AprX
MISTQRSGSSFVFPGGARSLHLGVAILTLVGIALTVSAASAQSHKARLSRDLDAVIRGTATAPGGGIDVIISGSSDRIQRIASRHNATIKKSIKSGAVLTVTRAQLLTLADDSELGVLSSDGTMRADMALVAKTTGAEKAWHGEIARLGAVTGKGVGVAIIDSGVDNHTALAGRVVARMDFTGHMPHAGGRDEYGHGTHVAGIVAAGLPRENATDAPVGMAPDAHLVSLKVLGADGSGKASDVIEAIDWAIDHKDQYRLRILNLSLGMAPTQSYKDDPVCQAVERAVKAGLLVVASAGNHGATADGKQVFGSISSPGISPFAITVGALRTNGTADPSDDYVAPWSSKGPTAIDHLVKPDLAAPGSKVVSLLADGSKLATDHPERIVLGDGRNGYF